MGMIDDYDKKYDEFIKKAGLECKRTYKISGNIFAHLMREYIKKIVKSKYTVSVVNSYISGIGIEWDLLILNKPTIKEATYNIYDQEHVVCALEFKTSGAVFAKNPTASKEYIKKYIDALKGTNIKYGYISLCEIPDNLKSMKKAYKDNCFWLIEGYYRDRNIDKTKTNDLKDFEKYLKNLINI